MRYFALAVALVPFAAYALWQSSFDTHTKPLTEAGSLTLTLTVSQIGGATNDIRVIMSKPNMFRVEEPNRVITTDGKTVWTYDKSAKAYDEGPAGGFSALKWLQDNAWVYSAFFDEKFTGEIASAVKGNARKFRSVDVTDWTVTRKDKQVVQVQVGNELGVPLGFRYTRDRTEIIAFAKEIHMSSEPISGDEFVFKVPAGATKQAAAEAKALTFADIKPILDQNCVGCHSGAGAKKGVDLSSYASVSKYVTPGEPGSSRMLAPVKRGQMPPGRPLPTESVTKLEAWVKGGAKP